jgi:hypothetical protein
MGRKKREQVASKEITTPKVQSWLTAIVAALAAAAVAFGATYVLATQPKPLGVPVPPPPAPLYKIAKEASNDSSVIHRELPVGWLGRLAPQPDGLPYLHEHYHSDKLGFDIRYPYGVENVIYGADTFLRDNVDSQAKVAIDQPLAAFKVSLPNNDGKTQLEYAKQLVEAALKAGAKPVESPREVQLPGGGFATFAYRRSDPDNDYVHRIYCAVVSKRILIFDFFLRPETAAEGNRYTEKIMRSFQPGEMLSPAMEKPAPDMEQDKPANPEQPHPKS